MIDEEYRGIAESAVLSTYNRYMHSHIEWFVRNLTKKEVQDIYSIRKADIDEAYSHFNDYLGIYSEEEAKEAIRAVMVDWAETDVAPKISSGYTKHSLFKGITDEEHAKYALENILKGK